MELERAKQIVSSLADGVDPFTGAPLPADHICNNAEVVRAFYALLGASAPKKAKKLKKPEFYLNEAQKEQYPFSPAPISASEMVKQMNALAELETCHKLTYAAVVQWLLEIGALEQQEKKKRPTAEGEALGIRLEHRVSQNGPYTVVTYDREAQQFILDHLEAIAALTAANRPSNRPQHGRPWTAEQEADLATLYSEGRSAKEIAATLERAPGGVRARLKKLGLISQ